MNGRRASSSSLQPELVPVENPRIQQQLTARNTIRETQKYLFSVLCDVRSVICDDYCGALSPIRHPHVTWGPKGKMREKSIITKCATILHQ